MTLKDMPIEDLRILVNQYKLFRENLFNGCTEPMRYYCVEEEWNFYQLLNNVLKECEENIKT